MGNLPEGVEVMRSFFSSVILMISVFLMVFTSVASAAETTVIPTWTLSGYQVVKTANASQQVVFPVNISNFATEEDCNIAKNKQHTELATAGTSTSIGTISATDSIFTGSCIKVKQFAFSRNLF